MSIETIEVSREAKGDNPGFQKVVQFDMPASLAEAVQRLGEDMTYKVWRKQAVILVQATARRLFVQGKTEEEVNAYLTTYKMEAKERGPKKPRTKEDIVKEASGLSKEDLAAAIQALRDMQRQKAAA